MVIIICLTLFNYYAATSIVNLLLCIHMCNLFFAISFFLMHNVKWEVNLRFPQQYQIHWKISVNRYYVFSSSNVCSNRIIVLGGTNLFWMHILLRVSSYKNNYNDMFIKFKFMYCTRKKLESCIMSEISKSVYCICKTKIKTYMK